MAGNSALENFYHHTRNLQPKILNRLRSVGQKKIFTSVATIFRSLVFLGRASQRNSRQTREMAAVENALPE